ncbi:MAG: hypothetical protein VXB01_03265 [Opitutae bacterium]|jgi:hypothetical protein
MTRFYSQFHLSSDANDLQNAVRKFADDTESSPFQYGVFLEQVQLKTGQDNQVGHSLGHKANGYLVLTKSAQADIFDGVNGIGESREHIKLRCSADVTVNLWVF